MENRKLRESAQRNTKARLEEGRIHFSILSRHCRMVFKLIILGGLKRAMMLGK